MYLFLVAGGDRAEEFRNRKGVFSINVQCVVNSDLMIMDIVARWPGSAHDSTIFNSSRIKARLETGEFGDRVLLGDSAYPLSSTMMTPIANPTITEEELFNKSQITTRNAVERTYGVWKRRFPILAIASQVKLTRFRKIIIATAVLHNMLREINDEDPPDDPQIEVDWEEVLNDEESEVPIFPGGSQTGIRGRTKQQMFLSYFARYS